MTQNRIVELAAQGWTQVEIAAEVGVSQSRVSRVLADARTTTVDGPALRAVERIAGSLGAMTADQEARVQAARVLAAKLDWTAGASTGAAAMAAASLTKEFRSILDELRAASSFDELRQALLADDGR